MDRIDIGQQLKAAGELWEKPAEAEAMLLAAQNSAPDNEEVQIALYRFYFYSHALEKALAHAQACMARAARSLGLSTAEVDTAGVDTDCHAIEASTTDFGDPANPQHRFYLFSLNAYGYLLARLGRIPESETVLARVRALDPRDRIGGGRLLEVVRAGPDPEQDDD